MAIRYAIALFRNGDMGLVIEKRYSDNQLISYQMRPIPRDIFVPERHEIQDIPGYDT
jgi:hypothetical protein